MRPDGSVPLLGLTSPATEKAGENPARAKDSNSRAMLNPLLGTICSRPVENTGKSSQKRSRESDDADVGSIKLTDFTEPRACEKRNERHPKPCVAGTLVADLIVAALTIDAATIERRVKDRMKLLALEREPLVALVDRIRQAQPAHRVAGEQFLVDSPVEKAAHVRHQRVGVRRADYLNVAAQPRSISSFTRRELREELARVSGQEAEDVEEVPTVRA